MSCKLDNEKTFDKEVFYSHKCEVCGLYAKIWHYRQCQDRLHALEQQGQDPLKQIKEAAKISATQTGSIVDINEIPTFEDETSDPKPQSPKKTKPKKKSNKKQSRRGR
mgnify:CR=1 FL=1